MTEYHKQTIIKQKASVTYWNQHPLKPEEYFAQFKLLREQRLAREYKS